MPGITSLQPAWYRLWVRIIQCRCGIKAAAAAAALQPQLRERMYAASAHLQRPAPFGEAPVGRVVACVLLIGRRRLFLLFFCRFSLLPPLLFIAALIGSAGVILPAALLMLATNGCLLPVYRWIADSTAFAWFTLSGALLEWLARVRVVVRGDEGC